MRRRAEHEKRARYRLRSLRRDNEFSSVDASGAFSFPGVRRGCSSEFWSSVPFDVPSVGRRGGFRCEVEVVIAPSPEPTHEVPETPGNTDVPIAPEDAQAHSHATSTPDESPAGGGDHAVTGNDEVGIAPQAPGAKTPKKGSATKSATDAKSPASVPSAQSTAPARDELAYTGSAETGGIAIGGFMLILTGAAGVWSVRRKTSS